jgi:regulator of sirC expression with transglutaminase-like and TPR domain
VILLPRDWDERRDRGLIHAELGAWDAAADDLDAYLHHSPQAADRAPIAERAAELRAQGRPRLH